MMNTCSGGEHCANECAGSCERARGRDICRGGKQKEWLRLRKVLHFLTSTCGGQIFGWKDIHWEIFADTLWVAVQEDTNETFLGQNLRQKCHRRPQELPLLGLQSQWSKTSNLPKSIKRRFISGFNLLQWESWMRMIPLNLWKGRTKKWGTI